MEDERKAELIALGNVLRELRKEREFSQDQLSLYSRVDRSYISELENGEKNPSFLTILSLCRALNIKPSELMGKYEGIITSTY